MEVRDSRRLTGPNILTDGPGAVLDIAFEAEDDAADSAAAIDAWRRWLRRILTAVGWGDARGSDRTFPGGASLAFRAPIDALYAATEVNEWAWEAAGIELDGAATPDLDEAVERLRRTIADEVSPKLLALSDAAREHEVAFLSDDDHASVGLGAGSQTWPVDGLPDPEQVPWDEIYDIKVGLVTGTNGKTTTVRLLGAMIRAAGAVPGLSSTDWIAAGDDILDRGDYSGPGGARLVLRDPRVECAILETARGGMLRRGLAVDTSDVALITNVAEDHLGEFGVHDLDALAACKFIVAKGARRLVLNADDPVARRHAEGISSTPITWFSLGEQTSLITEHVSVGGWACFLERGRLVLYRDGGKEPVVEVSEIPIALGGAARYNVANALAAIGVAAALGVPLEAIGEGLRTFTSTPEDNPGRLNTFTIRGAQVILDFAHNPHGMEALLEMAKALPSRRWLVTVGQAGDRDDAAVRDLARAVWRAAPDKIVIKEFEDHLRGRQPGEVPAILEREFRELGASDEQMARVDSEIAAARMALEWAQPGDLVLLLVHSRRDSVLTFLRREAEA